MIRAMIVVDAPHLRRYANGYWHNQTLADLAYTATEAEPGAITIIAGETVLTRADVLTEAEALAGALAAIGLHPGDVVSFLMPNWAEAAAINLACSIGGFVVNPIVHIYRDAEVGMMLADSAARVLFIASEFRGYDYAGMAERLRPVLPDLTHVVVLRGAREGMIDYAALVESGRGVALARPTIDPAGVKLLLYTSGTTGRPKGVLHSHNSLGRVCDQSSAYWGITPGDAMIMPSPVTHISGYANGLELPFRVGTRTILMESWDAAEAIGLIERYQVSGTVAATPFLIELAAAARAAGKKLRSLRFFACGGAAVPPDVIPAANAAFAQCRAFRVFGSSEAPLVTLGYPGAGDTALAATTDGAIVDYEVRIIDDAGHDLAVGQDGEILVRGPSMFLGYADAAQTAEAVDAEGYFRTGDIGRVTPEGALVITGRKKDLIIRGGENISAREIEDVLHLHQGVREAAVVAMPHPRLGEGVCAYIIPTDAQAADAAGLAAHVAASGLARQKIPERFVFVADFPRTASGKIRKDKLREMAAAVI